MFRGSLMVLPTASKAEGRAVKSEHALMSFTDFKYEIYIKIHYELCGEEKYREKTSTHLQSNWMICV